MRKAASISAIVVGIVMAIAGVVAWVVISNTLADQKITVSDDASCAAGDDVNGPISAFARRTSSTTTPLRRPGGKTYAELDREDPLRETAMQSSFLQASLFTSVVAYGVVSDGRRGRTGPGADRLRAAQPGPGRHSQDHHDALQHDPERGAA